MMEIFQENKRLFATIIAAIAIVTMTVSSMLAATASAISDTGKEHAQTPGSGVCNADDKIHHNAPPQADQGFHGGVGKNFGGPFEGFVGPTTPCQNELP